MNLSWQYIAGFVDGEGCLGIYPFNNGNGYIGKRAIIHFGQKIQSRKVIDKISKFLNTKGINHCVTTSNTGCRMAYIRIQHRKMIKKFLRKTMKYLIVKQFNAQKINNYIDNYPYYKRRKKYEKRT